MYYSLSKYCMSTSPHQVLVSELLLTYSQKRLQKLPISEEMYCFAEVLIAGMT
jgi:hypothetical protein